MAGKRLRAQSRKDRSATIGSFDPAQRLMLHCCGCHSTRQSSPAALMKRYPITTDTSLATLRALLRCRCGANLMTVSPVASSCEKPPRPARPVIFVTEMQTEAIWQCGDRQRPVTASQAARALEAAGHPFVQKGDDPDVS
jgi:hypothetical protein